MSGVPKATTSPHPRPSCDVPVFDEQLADLDDVHCRVSRALLTELT